MILDYWCYIGIFDFKNGNFKILDDVFGRIKIIGNFVFLLRL